MLLKIDLLETMEKMRIRIEIEDKGLKSSHEFESENVEGEVLREKVIGFLSASGVFDTAPEPGPKVSRAYESGGTLMDRLEGFIRFEFPNTWFTTQELREKYETVADDIKLSTVSTYLSRMNHDGILDKRGNRNNRQYRLISEVDGEKMPSQGIRHQNVDEKRRAEGRW